MFDETKITALIAIFFVTLVVGFYLFPSQPFCGSLIGHTLGIVGTIIMSLTLIYPYRKRILGKKGKKNPIGTHIYFGLIGPTLVVLHSGHDFASRIGNLCFLSMLLVVLSGIVGKFLFKSVNRTLKEHKTEHTMLTGLFAKHRKEMKAGECRTYFGFEGEGPAEAALTPSLSPEASEAAVKGQCAHLLTIASSMAGSEYTIRFFTLTKELFSRWIRIHIYLTGFLFALVIVHILTTIYYGLRWLR